MAGGKGSKGSKKPQGKGKTGGNAPKQKVNELPQLTPQERVDAVRPLWNSLAHPLRVQLLTADKATLRERAKACTEAARQQAVAEVDGDLDGDLTMITLEPTLEEVLEEGISRLKERPTWKLWTWLADQKEFTDSESFRQHVTENHIPEELRRHIPRDDPKSPERPAEEAFRKRMSDLLARVHQQNQRSLEEAAKSGPGKDRTGRKEREDKRAQDKDRKEKEKEKENGHLEESKKEQELEKDSTGEGRVLEGPVAIYRRRRHHAATDPALSARDTNIELVNVMLEALEQEHEVIYQSILLPVTSYIMEALPEEGRDTTKLELSYEDFDKLLPDDVLAIMEWLTEKVDALSSRLKADQEDLSVEEEEENMGDVDLWALSVSPEEGAEAVAEGGGTVALTVNPKWLQHLQERLLAEDGHPRKAKLGEDPHQGGLVLEWVYGSIVSTAEKARDGAKRPLGSYMPQSPEAHHALLRALEEQAVWDSRLVQARVLLSEMLKNRMEYGDLARLYDIKPVPKNAKPEELPADDSLPDLVIVAMLRREALLTKAKLHHLLFEHITQERQMRTWRTQLKQGEPEFERLKRELEEVKHSHRGLDGTYRSQAEMERHRAQLADAAIEEQLEVQTAFREQGAALQAIYDKKQRAEYDLARRETEIKQLQGWKGTVESLIDKFTEVLEAQTVGAAAGDVEEGGQPPVISEDGVVAERTPSPSPGSPPPTVTAELGEGSTSPTAQLALSPQARYSLSPQQYMQLVKLRSHVHKDVRKQLYTDTDDKLFFDNLKAESRLIEKRMEDNRVAVQHLEMQLMNVACDDPGISIGAQLILPALQDRLDAKAKEFKAERAMMAESEIMRMEVEQAAREAAERERKRAAKAAKKDKVKSEKEKEKEAKDAKEAAEREKKRAEEEFRKLKEEEDRRKRQQQLEELRRAEEEQMEARRRELLSDENGYWRQRMRMEEERALETANGIALSEDVAAEVETLAAAQQLQAAASHQLHPQGRGAGQGDRGQGHHGSQQEGADMVRRRSTGPASAAAGAPVPPLQRDSRGPSDQQQRSAPAHAPSKPAPTPTAHAPLLPTVPAPAASLASAPTPAAAPAPPARSAPPPAAAIAESLPISNGGNAKHTHDLLGPALPAGPAIYFGNVPVAVGTLPARPVPSAPPPGEIAAADAPHAPYSNGPPSAPPPHGPPAPGSLSTNANIRAGAQPVPLVIPGGMPGQLLRPVASGAPPPPAGFPGVSGSPHSHPLPMQQGQRVPLHMQPMQGPGPQMRMQPVHPGQPMPGQFPGPPPGSVLVQGPNGQPMYFMANGPGAPRMLAVQPMQPLMQHMQPHMGGSMPHGMGPQPPIPMQGQLPPPGPVSTSAPPQLGHNPLPHLQTHPINLAEGHGVDASKPAADGAVQAGTPTALGDKTLNAAAKPFVPSFGVRPVGPMQPMQQGQFPMQPQTRMVGQPMQQPNSREGARQQRTRQPGQAPPPFIPMPMQGQPPLSGQPFMIMTPNGPMAVDPRTGQPLHMSLGPHQQGPYPPQGMGYPGMPPGPMQGPPMQMPMQMPMQPMHQPPQGPPQGPPQPASKQGEPIPFSPEGPLDTRMDVSENSSASEDNHQSASHQGPPPPPGEVPPQHSTAQSAPQQPHRAQQHDAPPSFGTHPPLPEASPVAPPAEPLSTPGPDSATPPPSAVASAAAGAPPPPAGPLITPTATTWSAIAARERTQQVMGPGSPGPLPSPASGSISVPSSVPPALSNSTSASWKQMLQHNLPAAPAVEAEPLLPVIRFTGTAPVGNFLITPPTALGGSRLTVTETGAVMYEVKAAQPHHLQFVRGLRNGEGEYNCFLNVVIQSLWHLRPFRDALLGMTLPSAALSPDIKVLKALSSIFSALAAPPGTPQPSSATDPAPAGSPSPPPSGRTVSPLELRDALDTVRVGKSEMHDAVEVLGQILECLHRAEGQVQGSSAPDITLPQRVRVAGARPPPVTSVVHRLFGLDIQQPCPPASSDDEPGRGSRAALRHQRSLASAGGMPSGGSPSNSTGASGAGGQPAGLPVPEALQFTKFFHLVPAQGLRQAYALTPGGAVGCPWEELLAALDRQALGMGSAAAPGSMLLRRPKVIMLAMVWESPQVPPEAIRATLCALGPELEPPALFQTPPGSGWGSGAPAAYTLRVVVCYFGHHYLAFVLSEELNLWLCFDDADISLVGRWPDVCRAMLARRMQPSLLMYEDRAQPLSSLVAAAR